MNRFQFVSSTVFVLFVAFSITGVVHAQPIPPSAGIEADTVESDTANTSSGRTRTKNKSRSSSGRIIPPDEFGKYEPTTEEESELNQAALIEKLRADSASIRIRYEERIQQLRSDSQAMRSQIKKLRKKVRQLEQNDSEDERLRKLRSDSQAMRSTINQLREQVRQLKQTDRDETSDTQSAQESSDTQSAQDVSPTLPAEDSKTVQADTDMESDTFDGTQQSQTRETETAQDRSEDTESKEEGPESQLNPNTASLSELKSISVLSDRLAERIEWSRREVTPFDNLQDLRRVPGIDRQTFNRIQKYFYEGPY